MALTAAVMLLGAIAGRASDRAAAEGCAARSPGDAAAAIVWHGPPAEDRREADRWCRAVGPPLFVQSPALAATAPDLADLVVVTWNGHLAEGRVGALIEALRAGHLTGGRPVAHFVLLLQEVFRRGAAVPAFTGHARSAFAISARDPRAPDISDHASAPGLVTFYVPSMRNGAGVLEDRGNAVISSEPLHGLLAVELPLERQRRVAVGASIRVRTAEGPQMLRLLDAHLEPLSAPRWLWVFRNPRLRQVGALLGVLQATGGTAPPGAGVVLGGDFNTLQGGDDEEAYALARAWSTSLGREDTRGTHAMGRLDYLFFRLVRGWAAATVRIEDTFGSDHHPVLGRFARQDEPN